MKNGQKPQAIDEFDKKLLRLLQQNNKATADELGETVGLSPSAVQRRLKRLRDEKVIEADVSIISPTVAGIGVTCVVDIILEVGNSGALEKFKSAMNKCSEVMQCYFVTGTYDFVIIVNAKDMREYEEFTKMRLMDNPNVKHFYTHVVMDKVKVGYSIAI
ncbi:MAG: Lrp/AsnC family transcriptional regulator [Acidobacteria bacterium]|nr:Lrp/AsnC family transcriptional regulator [Acidobacteriota bacterium]